jgi:hypothetical protein
MLEILGPTETQLFETRGLIRDAKHPHPALPPKRGEGKTTRAPISWSRRQSFAVMAMPSATPSTPHRALPPKRPKRGDVRPRGAWKKSQELTRVEAEERRLSSLRPVSLPFSFDASEARSLMRSRRITRISIVSGRTLRSDCRRRIAVVGLDKAEVDDDFLAATRNR